MKNKITITPLKSSKSLEKIVRMHKRNIIDLTSSFDNSSLLSYYKNILESSGYIFLIKKNSHLIGFVAIQDVNSKIICVKVLKNILMLFIFNFFRTIEVMLVYFWLKKIKKRYSYEYSYTVIDKKFSGKGIYRIASFKILKFLKKNKINKLFVKTLSKDPITNFYKTRYNAREISRFLGRSFLEINLKNI